MSMSCPIRVVFTGLVVACLHEVPELGQAVLVLSSFNHYVGQLSCATVRDLLQRKPHRSSDHVSYSFEQLAVAMMQADTSISEMLHISPCRLILVALLVRSDRY